MCKKILASPIYINAIVFVCGFCIVCVVIDDGKFADVLIFVLMA